MLCSFAKLSLNFFSKEVTSGPTSLVDTITAETSGAIGYHAQHDIGVGVAGGFSLKQEQHGHRTHTWVCTPEKLDRPHFSWSRLKFSPLISSKWP